MVFVVEKIKPSSYLWFQIIYEITGWDIRSVGSWAGLFMFGLMLDRELNLSSKWSKMGGSKEMFRWEDSIIIGGLIWNRSIKLILLAIIVEFGFIAILV